MKWQSENERIWCEASIDRYQVVIDEYIKKYNEENKMEQEQIKNVEEITTEIIKLDKEELKNPFDDIGGTYLKLETGKPKILLLKNWKMEQIQRFKDEKTGLLKKQIEFSAEVVSEDGVSVNKIFATTSFNALQGLKEIFSKYWPDTTTPRLLRIKKIGEGKSTIYDIEEIKK